MNIYRHRFYARCPNDNRTAGYSIEIEAENFIMAEEIVAAGREADALPQPYHETIADMMFARFGGRQKMRAWHHGVEIETHRG